MSEVILDKKLIFCKIGNKLAADGPFTSFYKHINKIQLRAYVFPICFALYSNCCHFIYKQFLKNWTLLKIATSYRWYCFDTKCNFNNILQVYNYNVLVDALFRYVDLSLWHLSSKNSMLPFLGLRVLLINSDLVSQLWWTCVNCVCNCEKNLVFTNQVRETRCI
jgi:hypothetical protein